MVTETVQQKITTSATASFAIIIVKAYKDIKILDRTISEWLTDEMQSIPTFVINKVNNDADLRQQINLYCKNFDYFITLYNNTPYITKNLIMHIMEYVTAKKSNACKLFSGFVCNSKYFVSNSNIVYDNFYMQAQDRFATIDDTTDIERAEKFFSSKVITKHINAGVKFDNPNSVILSSNCTIGYNTLIMNNCVIKGKCTIGKNVIINNNTTILDSTIGDGSSVSNSIVNKSKIGSNSIISPYCNIEKSRIGDNCIIGHYCIVRNTSVKKGQNIAERTTLIKEGK